MRAKTTLKRPERRSVEMLLAVVVCARDLEATPTPAGQALRMAGSSTTKRGLLKMNLLWAPVSTVRDCPMGFILMSRAQITLVLVDSLRAEMQQEGRVV